MKKTIVIIAISMAIQVTFAQAQDALEVVKKSLKAYGNWNEIETFEYDVNGARDAGAQAKTYKSDARQSYSARRIYNLPERQLYEVNKNYFPGGYVFNFATVVNDTVAFQYDIDGSRLGKMYQTGGKATADSRLKVASNHIAYFKVKGLTETSGELQLIDADTSEFIIVRMLSDKAAPVADYHFSRQSLLLHKLIAGPQEMVFDDYTSKDDRMDNGTVSLSANGSEVYNEKVTVKRVDFPFDKTLLEIPAGYVKSESREISKPLEIAHDIYLIENLAGDRNVLFVNMDKYIVVIEAPISSELSKQVISMIREIEPEKPIKYVFSTHYHSDHTGGLRQFVYEGAELVMTAPTREYVKELIAADRPDDLDSAKTKATFLTIKDVLVLKDANHTIEFHEVTNTHSDGMALAWFPKEKIIYQGDLLSVPQDGTLIAPIEVTQELFEFLKSNNLKFMRMIGHHGHNNITPSMIDKIKSMGKR